MTIHTFDALITIQRQDWNAWDLNIADLNSALVPEDDQNAEETE